MKEAVTHTIAKSSTLTLYALAAGAATTADAEIVYYGPEYSYTVTEGNSWFLEGSSGSTELANLSSASFPYYQYNGFRFADEDGEKPVVFSPGDTISAGKFLGSADGSNVGWTSSSSGYTAGNDWRNFTIGQSAYAGFRFTNGSTTNYGWVELTILPNHNGVLLSQWAYEDTGANIIVAAGAVPEPAEAAGALGLLALGAAGLRRYRARRSAAA